MDDATMERLLAEIARLHAIEKAAKDMAAALETACDYASDTAAGMFWYEARKGGNDTLTRLSTEQGGEDLKRFTAALSAFNATQEGV